jgi:succinyl-CoA synthetase beta subunit
MPTPQVRTALLPPSVELGGTRSTINEFDSKRILADAGIPVTRETLVQSSAEAGKAAGTLGYPIVLKVAADAIPHKSEHGLVAVGLADEKALDGAFAKMEARVEELGRSIQGYLVQEMVKDGVEVFAGVSRDPDFGLSLAFGMGGIAIEILRDFALRPLPLREGDAEAMIAETRGAALLGPVRGRPAKDVAALARCLYALADFAVANGDRLKEIDLNPIKVRSAGSGCIVVDALIVTR